MTAPLPEPDDELRRAIAGSFRELVACLTGAQLRAQWLDTPELHRRYLRRSTLLAHHAWSLIIRDHVLRGTTR